MTIGSADFAIAQSPAGATIHPAWVRVTHWLNVLAMFVMITSGWRIYNASPLFGFEFPPAITIGDGLDGLSGALLWHFAAMWLLVVNGLVYLTLGIVSGRFRRKLLPVRAADVVRDLDNLLEMEVAIGGKGYVFRGQSSGVTGKVFQACGVALPPVLRSG